MTTRFLLCLTLAIALGVASADPAGADVGPPAHLQIIETEDGVFRVQWRVPTVLPPRAVPVPELPETCTPLEEPQVSNLPGAWLFQAEWRCEEGLAGQLVGMDYPFAEYALTTVAKVELLSGDRFAHVLSPGDPAWRLPEGTAAPNRLRDAQWAVIEGVRHVLGSLIHLVFLLVLVTLGTQRRMLDLVSALTLGQLAGALAASLIPEFDPVLAELGFVVAVVVLARQALRPEEQRHQLGALCAVAGLLHGLGIPALLGTAVRGSGVGSWILVILGMDAAHLAGALLLAMLLSRITRIDKFSRLRRSTLYILGATSMAFAFVLSVQGGNTSGDIDAAALLPSPVSSSGSAASTPASQRIAPALSQSAVQSFFVIEPFELRHETMLRLDGLRAEFDMGESRALPVEEQPALRQGIAEWLMANTRLQVDGSELNGLLRRVDFMVVDPTGALPRPNPVEEQLESAVVGAVIAYPISGMPTSAELVWKAFPRSESTILATLIDPESVVTEELSAESSSIRWENALLEDPIPEVNAVQIEALRIPVPWLSIPLLALALYLLVSYLRQGRSSVMRLAWTRVVLALAVLVGPFAESAISFANLSARVPSERQARRILAGLIPNVYRAIEFRDEAIVYDRLAVSVTGESLADVFLQQRNALELEERGGAQARVESVEILEATEIEGSSDGFSVLSSWTVGGLVTHFGHRHFRQNRYRARLEITAVSDTWKIRSIEVLEQGRLK